MKHRCRLCVWSSKCAGMVNRGTVLFLALPCWFHFTATENVCNGFEFPVLFCSSPSVSCVFLLPAVFPPVFDDLISFTCPSLVSPACPELCYLVPLCLCVLFPLSCVGSSFHSSILCLHVFLLLFLFCFVFLSSGFSCLDFLLVSWFIWYFCPDSQPPSVVFAFAFLPDKFIKVTFHSHTSLSALPLGSDDIVQTLVHWEWTLLTLVIPKALSTDRKAF